MPKREPYWIGIRPPNGRKWTYTSNAKVIDDPTMIESLFRLYRRYAKQWNDIELDSRRSLAEHTHEVCGAKVVGDSRCFILHGGTQQGMHWVLELWYSRGFSPYYTGSSCGRNTMRATSDIKSARLHYSSGGEAVFAAWLDQERRSNKNAGEWTIYK